jgi:hypothetical protein
MIPSYIHFQDWARIRDFMEDLRRVQCRFLVRLGAPLPKLLMSTIFICHGSLN